MVVFLNCNFLFFILFFPSHHLSSIHFFFFFFSLDFFSTAHVSHFFPLSTFFSLSSSFWSFLQQSPIYLSLSLSLLFLFLLDSRTLSPSISHKQILSHTHIDHRQRSGDRRSTWVFFISFILLSRFH